MGALGCIFGAVETLDDSVPRIGTEVWEGQSWMSVPLGWATGQERHRVDDERA